MKFYWFQEGNWLKPDYRAYLDLDRDIPVNQSADFFFPSESYSTLSAIPVFPFSCRHKDCLRLALKLLALTRKDSQAAVTQGHLLGMHCASVSIRLLGKVIAVCQAVEGCLRNTCKKAIPDLFSILSSGSSFPGSYEKFSLFRQTKERSSSTDRERIEYARL